MKILVLIVGLGTSLFIAPSYAKDCAFLRSVDTSILSQPQSLRGTMVQHHGLRPWLELRLDRAYCQQAQIQVIPDGKPAIDLPRYRGCKVQTSGQLFTAPSAYYSSPVVQAVETIETINRCQLSPPTLDYSQYRPHEKLNAYRVDMRLRYADAGHDTSIHFSISNGKKRYRPWQAYASYMFTGGLVLYGYCADGFMVDRVFGDALARPQHFDERGAEGDMAQFDPETAAASGKHHLHLTYTCVRRK